MRIALIGSEERYVVRGPGGASWPLFNFRFTTMAAEVDLLRLPSSAFSTPARYLMEIACRVVAQGGAAMDPLLLFNPLCDPGPDVVGSILARAVRVPHMARTVIFSDEDGRPVAYLLPVGGVPTDYRLISVLSTVNSVLDGELLTSFGFGEVRHEVLRLQAWGGLGNGFYGGDYYRVYEWVAESARRVSATGGGNGSWPIYAYMPHHAGDVLFFSLAVRASHGHVVEGVAVNAAYQPIVRDLLPSFETVSLDSHAMNRGGVALPEWEYFQTLKDRLPRDRCFYYLRPVRDYDAGDLHLIDQYAFAIGHACLSQAELPSRNPQVRPASVLPTIEKDSVHVLLHFDGGWALKVYPRAKQELLVALLAARGYTVTVLDGKYPLPCRMERFSGLEGFRALLAEQHLLIGMDSFPVHYAAHIVGLPTICLYSSTRPANSDAPVAADYRALERGLGCRPCRATATCPIYGSSDCDNFVAPEVVVSEMENLLTSAYPAIANGAQP